MSQQQLVSGVELHIHYFFQKLKLNSGASYWFYDSDKNNRFLLEVSGDIEILTSKRKIRLANGMAVIGQKMKVTNSGNAVVTIKGVSFSIIQPQKESIPSIVICNLSHANTIRNIIDEVVEDSTSMQMVEEQLALLCRSYVTEKTFEETYRTAVNTDMIDPRLILINRYIRKFCYQPLTLESLASLIKCNPVYLSNVYSKVFQESPMKYLQKVRMEKARQLLTYTNDPISEIANKVGYVSTSQFGSFFKRYYNETPYKYRMRQMLTDYEPNEIRK